MEAREGSGRRSAPGMTASKETAGRGDNRPLRVGIAGLGTVGSGVVKLLAENAEILRLHCPRAIEVVAVSARDKDKDRGIDLQNLRWTADPLALADDPTVDVVAEMIGGADGIAKALVEKAIANGKHVVTANKALRSEERRVGKECRSRVATDQQRENYAR